MKKRLKNVILISIGWVLVVVGVFGLVVPIIPGTPLLIIALALFSKSSERFHQMLLNNPWFGSSLKRWEDTKTMSRQDKRRAFLIVSITFSASIYILGQRPGLQIMLACIGTALLLLLWSIKVDTQECCCETIDD